MRSNLVWASEEKRDGDYGKRAHTAGICFLSRDLKAYLHKPISDRVILARVAFKARKIVPSLQAETGELGHLTVHSFFKSLQISFLSVHQSVLCVISALLAKTFLIFMCRYDCEDIWRHFEKAVVRQSPCNVTVEDYHQMFYAMAQTWPPACNRVSCEIKYMFRMSLWYLISLSIPHLGCFRISLSPASVPLLE